MSGRIVNVRPKPGFAFDGQDVFPSNVVPMHDGLKNIMAGRGTSIDRSVQTFWHFVQKSAQQIGAAYRGSWLIAKIVDLPALDMVREGREWEADEAEIEKIEATERRLKVWPTLLEALVLARLGGGAVLLGTNARDLAEPLRKGEKLLYLKAVSRHRLTPGAMDFDPGSETFDEPQFFTLSGRGTNDRIHASRLLIFRGERVPDLLGNLTEADWWGDSVIDRVDRAVKDAQTVSEGFAGLVDEAKLDVYRIQGLAERMLQPGGEAKLRDRFETTAMGKSNWRGIYLDKEDEWETRQLTWTGMPEMVRAYLAIVAGAADIPATRLLGKSPDGMNATGESDLKNYWSMIATGQEMTLRPQLEKLDAVLLPTAGVKADIYWTFSPLDTPSEKELADIEKVEAETAQVYANSGTVPMPALEKSVQQRMIDSGRWPVLGDELAKLPEDAGEGDEGDLLTEAERQAALLAPEDKRRAANDAKPRTLYVQRKLLNAAELIRWAKAQGFETTLPADDMHVTVLFSRTAVDWMKMGSPWSEDTKGELTVPPGGARIVEPLGDKGAVVLLFNASALSWRHEEMVRNGASHDFDEYQPHVTITYAGSDVDLTDVEPYRGELRFGPEIFEELDDDWASKVSEK